MQALVDEIVYILQQLPLLRNPKINNNKINKIISSIGT